MRSHKNTLHVTSALIIFIIGMFFSASLVGAFSIFENKLTKNDTQGAVKISAQYLIAKQKKDNATSFQLSLDTHSVDLGKYDIARISFLQFDNQAPVNNGSWDFTGSGHHFKGIITFNLPVPEGTKTIRLLVRGVDGVQERVFEWALPVG